ncbi:MAG: gamma carbonic anhydrase family protein [Nitrospirota bacterium]|nr:gamma carbonic anhydrase family protein [Nitrospirota bacterium]
MLIKPYKGIHPKLHPTVFVVETAVIIGDVEIGEYSSIWFNAVVRGDVHYIRIGDRTNIQDLCMLHVTKETHPLILGNDITVGHSVTLHGCTIKDRCLIGMGTTILDGAVVGEDCIIGAGALVTEGAVIPPKTLAVGMPAKPKRDLTEKEIARIRQSAQNYIDYARTYGV